MSGLYKKDKKTFNNGPKFDPKPTSAYNNIKLKLSEHNGATHGNFSEWYPDIKDEICKFGDIYKYQCNRKKFSLLSEDKLKKKYEFRPELPVTMDYWMAVTLGTDQITISNIADREQQKNMKLKLYGEFVNKTLKDNASIAAENTINKSYLDNIGKRIQEQKDYNSAIFAIIRQSIDRENMDLIENHIVKSYGIPYVNRVTAGMHQQGGTDDLDEEIDVGEGKIEGADTEAQIDDLASISTLKDPADTSYEQAEKLSDWVWLLIAAEETHVVRLVGTDPDDIERVQDREDAKLRTLVFTSGPITAFNRMFRIQVQTCAVVGKHYENSTSMRLYMDAMPKDLFDTNKKEYNNITLRSGYGSTIDQLKDRMSREFEILKEKFPDKIYTFIRGSREVTLATKDSTSPKSTCGISSQRDACEICGKDTRLTGNCNFYKKCHKSIDEAKANYATYLEYRDKCDKQPSDDESISSKESKSKSKTTENKGTVAKPKKVNMIKGTITKPDKKSNNIINHDINEESRIDTDIIIGYDNSADVGIIPKDLTADLKVNKGGSVVKGYDNKLSTYTEFIKNGLGYFVVVPKSEHNRVIISHFQTKDDWDYSIDGRDTIIITNKKSKKTLTFSCNPHLYGTTMPSLNMSVKEFTVKEFNDLFNTMSISGISEMCNAQFKEMAFEDKDKQLKGYPVQNYSYLSKYKGYKGNVSQITFMNAYRCGSLIQFGDFEPVEEITLYEA